MLNSDSSLIIDSEQERLLESAIQLVKSEAFDMKRCLDRNELMDGLKHAANMLSELRTSYLSPKFYYRLYIDVTSELQHILIFLKENYLCETPIGKVTELYETVQYTGNIIPRLYLLITVGVVYIKSGETPPKDVLRDLVEMCRGVQHPLRGLFLRNYLLTSTKELIPDEPLANLNGANSKGDVNDSIEFVMTNFSEMNKLWVRMQHQGPSKEREKRERERRELRILVGTNLVRLSQLENLDLDLYRRTVLPRILEQSVSCKEPISQEYLMECVIQVFPDTFHLSTLHEFLEACAELHEQVQIKNVLGTLIDHLALYAVAEDSPGIPDDIHLFEIFSQHAEQVIGTRTEMPTEHIISIQIALLNLACYQDKPEFANTVFITTSSLFKKLNILDVPFNSVIGRELVKLLKIPIEHYKNVILLLKLNKYGDVLNCLDLRGKKHIASILINNMIENETEISQINYIDEIFVLLESLLMDPVSERNKDSEANNLNETSEDFEEEQTLVAKLVHLVNNEDLEQNFKLLNKIRKHFGFGEKSRLRYTLPPTIFATFRLLHRYSANRQNISDFDARICKIFNFCMNTINALKQQAEMPEIALKFCLQSALLSNKINCDKSTSITYEFVSKAFSIYEEDISESREQVQCLTLLIATIQQLNKLSEESHEPLRNQCALYASKLIKRSDQARMICLVSRLYWFSKVANQDFFVRDKDRVLECLKKATKIAAQCMEDLVQNTLYVHILSTYLYFYEEGCETILPETINQMIDKIRDSLGELDATPEADQLNELFTGIIKRLKEQQSNPPPECLLSFEKFVL